MAKPAFIFIWCIAIMANILGQVPKNKLYQKITQADSVILLSHLTTYELIGSPRLVVQNKLNQKIIKERYRLNASEMDTIARILITPNTDREIKNNRCFMPHHGIVIYKMGKCAFLDICFTCQHFVTSKDILLSDELSEQTWKMLEQFFRVRGLRYELPGEVSDANEVE